MTQEAWLAAGAAIGGALIAGGPAWLTARRVMRTDRGHGADSAEKYRADAYAQARSVQEGVVADLRSEVDRLRNELKEERDGRLEDNRRHSAEIEELRTLVDQLHTELDVTRAQLRMPRMQFPDEHEGGH